MDRSDKKLKERLFSTCKFSNHKSILFLRKGVCEYIDHWEKLNETS